MSRMMLLEIPDDPELLAAVARVAIAHGHHELIMKRTLKTVNGWELEAADAALKRRSISTVRQWLRNDLARRLGAAPEVDRMAELLDRSEALSDRRNDLMHGIWCRELDGERMHLGDAGLTIPAPADLDDLAWAIKAITDQINDARLNAWLAEALARSPWTDGAARQIPGQSAGQPVPAAATAAPAAPAALPPTAVSAVDAPYRPGRPRPGQII